MLVLPPNIAWILGNSKMDQESETIFKGCGDEGGFWSLLPKFYNHQKDDTKRRFLLPSPP